MDLEKLAARARSSLLLVSFVGILITGLGILLTAAIIARTTSHPNEAVGADWIDGLVHAAGPMALVGAGLLITFVPWALWPVLSILFRRAVDARYRSEQ